MWSIAILNVFFNNNNNKCSMNFDDRLRCRGRVSLEQFNVTFNCFYGGPVVTLVDSIVGKFLHQGHWEQSLVACGKIPQSFPQKCPFAWGDLDPHLIHSFLGPPESTSQTVSQSVQPFLQDWMLWQTDRARYSICGNRPYLATVAMWTKNNNNLTMAHDLQTYTVFLVLKLCLLPLPVLL